MAVNTQIGIMTDRLTDKPMYRSSLSRALNITQSTNGSAMKGQVEKLVNLSSSTTPQDPAREKARSIEIPLNIEGCPSVVTTHSLATNNKI